MTVQPKILIYPGSGLGDCLVSMPIMHSLREYVAEDQVFDVITNQNIEAVKTIYYGLPFIGQFLENDKVNPQQLEDSCDGLFACNELVGYKTSEAFLKVYPEFSSLLAAGLKNRAEFGKVNQAYTVLNNQLGNHAVFLGLDRRSVPMFSLGMPKPLETIPVLQLHPGAVARLDAHDLRPGEFITIQNGWDANFPLNKPGARPTKSWPENAWAALVTELRRRHPDKKIVQLGSPITGWDIPNVDLNLRGKASLSDALALLKYAALHIDTEGGMVHMARALHTRSIVLFGPTNAKFFGYERNKNLVPLCTNCWWITENWMSECLRGLNFPECMISHTPQNVADVVAACLLENPKPSGAAIYAAAPPLSSNAVIGVANNANNASDLAAAGYYVTHFDLTGQKNIQRSIAGVNYRQYLARTSNLPVENQTLNTLYFTANENVDEFASELLESLRVLKSGGHAVIATSEQNVVAAFIKAKLAPPTGDPSPTLILKRH